MYRCQLCGETSPPRTQANTIIVERRKRHYPCRVKQPHACPLRLDPRKKKPEPEILHGDHGGVGWEIVRELRVCADCKASSAGQPSPTLASA